jgi:hypothetical protein
MSVIEDLLAKPATGFRQRVEDKADEAPLRPGATPPPDDDGELPLPGGEYLACNRLGNKPEMMLTLIRHNGEMTDFAYGDLRRMDYRLPTTPSGKPVLVLQFIGLAVVIVKGRRLDTLYRGLHRHRVSWLWELPPGQDFLESDAVVISEIQILKPEAGEP